MGGTKDSTASRMFSLHAVDLGLTQDPIWSPEPTSSNPYGSALPPQIPTLGGFEGYSLLWKNGGTSGSAFIAAIGQHWIINQHYYRS